MIPDFIFEWIALNPKTATTYIVVFSAICSGAAWIGFFLENMDSDE